MPDKQSLPLFSHEEPTNERLATCLELSQPDSPFSKYIVYVDESGDHGMETIDPQYPLFVLAFCVFHKRHYSEHVVPTLEKFKFNHFGHDQVILHEHEIRKEKGQFNIFRSPEQKRQFLYELTQVIEHSNFILICCVIDKRNLKKEDTRGTNPYHIALGFCLEKLHAFLAEKQQESLKTHVVVECRGKKEDNDLALEFRRICDGNNRLGIPMPFDILFADKKTMSSGLQLADLVARPVGLSFLRPDQPNRAFDVLKPKFYCDGGRAYVGRGYEQRGLVVFPPLESERPR